MKKLLTFLKENYIACGAVALIVFMELFAITYTECFPFLTRPLYPLIILAFFVLVSLLIKKDIFKIIYFSIILFVQLFLDTLFIFLYDSNGTVFEWAMFNQRNDATGTLEKFDLQFGYIAICAILIVIYIILTLLKRKKTKTNTTNITKKKNLIALTCLIVLIVTIPFIKAKINENRGYITKIYDTTSNNYQNIGIIGNAIHQVIRGKNTIKLDDIDQIDNFIYKDSIYTSEYNGISKDNNLIMILAESLEWYPFTLFPEYKEKLYPNLTALFNSSIIGNNFYQKEKTDVSEALAVLGNYPTGQYINYDFPTNKYPFSLPNLIRNQAKDNNESIAINSYHANYGDFYNRYELHQSWGFDRLYAINEMNNYGVLDTWQHRKGERNLDSITFEKMKEEMFATDERFFSYILSFSMHGYYGTRENLKDYYKVIDSYHLFDNKTSTNDEYLKTYMAALMDFDKAIGTMMNYLKEKQLLNMTTIVIFSDHNSYYNSLSNYAKNIEEKYTSELFHIPFCIYDTKLYNAYTKNESTNMINKFTTTADITPTILDLFGINGWKNMYFGNSVLVKNVESIVYSRNYNIFITDKFVGYSLKHAISQDKDITKDDLQSIEERAIIHLNRLEYIDKIYYSDYYKNHKYKFK